MITLALVQMRVDGGAKTSNLSRAEERIAQAAHRGAQVVLLPEALNLGWTHPSAHTDADAIPDGESCARLRAAARACRVHVCAGLVERAGNRVFNSAVLIAPGGEILLVHRKLNELEIGHAFYAPGDRLAVARTALGTIGVMICADAFARGQVVGRALGLMGADLILSPSAWAVPAGHDPLRDPYGQLWLDNYAPVARDFRLWIAGASNVGPMTAGPWQGRRCIGCSLLVGPDGQPALQGPYGEQAEALLQADIQLVPLPARGDGWETLWRRIPAP
ncbi:MAG: carbon-nitrogen hydrolase family protein [Verrucomicrobia bacterium]|nr:carbon-nitrogen hydrolase family protein [Verrucomicrobiota bacterium]